MVVNTTTSTVKDERFPAAINDLSEWQAKNFINALLRTCEESGSAHLNRTTLLALIATVRSSD